MSWVNKESLVKIKCQWILWFWGAKFAENFLGWNLSLLDAHFWESSICGAHKTYDGLCRDSEWVVAQAKVNLCIL